MEKKANKNSGLFQTMADKFSRFFRRDKQPTVAPTSQEPIPQPTTTPVVDAQPVPAAPSPKAEEADVAQPAQPALQPTSQTDKTAQAAPRFQGKKRLHISELNREEAQALLENYLAEHLSDEMLSVETMAAQLKVSRTGLYQLVHDNFDMTPANFIMIRRLDHARKLLAEGRKVREVSLKCGFSDPKYFSKVFKKTFNVLPSNFVG